MKIWGLTGGIGAGKSSVAAWFKEKGVPVLDADQMAREVLTPEMVIEHFGPEFVSDGEIDRLALASHVFEDAQERQKLEALTHPLIAERLGAALETLQNAPLVIYEAALIFEKGLESRFDAVIWVTAPQEIRIERLLKKGLSKTDIEGRMNAQISDAEARAKASYVVDNAGTQEALRQQLSVIFDKLL